MTVQELEITLKWLGLEVPEAELQDLVNIMRFVEEIRGSIRKNRPLSSEPAFIPYFLDEK